MVSMQDFEYYRYALKKDESKHYFNYFLHNAQWFEGFYHVAGMKIKYPRMMCWYGQDKVWPAPLTKLKVLVESMTKSSFNAALLNLYRDGNDSVGWHSDREVKYSPNPLIASLSLGAPRKFMIKNKETKKEIMFVLESGDLLLMKKDFQKNWLHSVPKMPTADGPRINITFRHVKESLVERNYGVRSSEPVRLSTGELPSL